MADISSLDLCQVKEELIQANWQCNIRGLTHGATRLAELAYCLKTSHDSGGHIPSFSQPFENLQKEYCVYSLAKSYFDLKEYLRAVHFLEQSELQSNVTYFLYMYSRYLAEEKRRSYNMTDSFTSMTSVINDDLARVKILKTELSEKHQKKELDGFCLYLYGVVLKKLDLLKEATNVLLESVHKEPLHWGAWQELNTLIPDKETLQSLTLPNHWIKHLFLAHMYSELQHTDEALQIYQSFIDNGFADCTYIQAQMAIAHDNSRSRSFSKNFILAQIIIIINFNVLTLLNSVGFRSLILNVFFIFQENRVELAYLAHSVCEIDKYRVETCCVIANYYSLRSQHEKALLYFQRALKLNPHYLSAWTLIGHEYMEMKNITAAIEAYRQAIEVNSRDFRAWYGLGQTYEIMKMHYYSLYYYWKAQQLRPNDSRMLVALGDGYEKLERLQEAKKCYWKAHSVGDVEGIALMRLARLYERLNEEQQAAAAYSQYINQVHRQNTLRRIGDQNNFYASEEMAQAYKYLANFYLRQNRLDEAYHAAQQCTSYNETKEEGKALLRQIAHLRVGDGATQMEESTDSITNELPETTVEHSPLMQIISGRHSFTPP
ncbi:cell division cycle protein 23 homolog [Octopus bimaculoides]|nr:cell division cycle protein 23 homolog [Octopus bimaculoides]|eukprot:XP_014779222.1 PREDICTED: cell division cycle protein 23 homolog [Octopus bimaculoides]